MDKLFKMLERSKMPNFLEVLAALNDVSDIDWDAIETSQLSIRDVFKTRCMPKGGVFGSRVFCESCG